LQFADLRACRRQPISVGSLDPSTSPTSAPNSAPA
jgi:hypothetical protein